MTHFVICVICPGFHPPELTDRAIARLDFPPSIQPIIIPTDQIWPCDPVGIANYIERHMADADLIPGHHPSPKLNFLGFSAGTIGALGAALLWRDRASLGAIVLCDGWGVPLLPVWNWWPDGWPDGWRDRPGQPTIAPRLYRVSHDRWTHDTWSRMGITTPSFIADPEVEHLTLWSDPHRVSGHAVDATGQAIATLSAKDYIRQCLDNNIAPVDDV